MPGSERRLSQFSGLSPRGMLTVANDGYVTLTPTSTFLSSIFTSLPTAYALSTLGRFTSP